MVRKIFFFLFCFLVLASLVTTIVFFVGAKQEYARVDAQPGNPSGVDYLAAYWMLGMARFFCIIAIINAIITLFLGLSVAWKKEKNQNINENIKEVSNEYKSNV